MPQADTVRQFPDAHSTRNQYVFGAVSYGQDKHASNLVRLFDPLPQTTLFDSDATQRKFMMLFGVHFNLLTINALSEKLRTVLLLQAIPI